MTIKARALKSRMVLIACTAAAACASELPTINVFESDPPDVRGTWTFAEVTGHPLNASIPNNGTCTIDPFTVQASLLEGHGYVATHSGTTMVCSGVTPAATAGSGLRDTTVTIPPDSARVSSELSCILGLCAPSASFELWFTEFYFYANVAPSGSFRAMDGDFTWRSSDTVRVFGHWKATR